jgi:hypothetical protein
MKLAACLVTCGRHDLTWRTVKSFAQHNDLADPRLVLLQADEPSMGPESGEIGRQHGFSLVRAPVERGGQMEALAALVLAAVKHEATHVLWMENDWESLAPLPWPVIDGPQTTRLFGVRKRLDNHPRAMAGQHVLGTKQRVRWTKCESAAAEGWETGDASWAAGGSIIRTSLLASQLHARRLKQIMLNLGPLWTRRPAGLANVMVSIGDETTQGFQD